MRGSPYLATLFQTEIGGEKAQVDMSHYSKDTVERIVHYMYGKVVHFDMVPFDELCELFVAAD